MIGADLTRCRQCNKRFGSYHAMSQHVAAVHADSEQFPYLTRYWNDPAFRAEADAERVRKQAELNAQIDASARRAWERQHGITS